MNNLRNIHLNQPVYIIGKGPSLQFLNRLMIGNGIIITINDAIEKIEELDLPNVIYSMQKDGLSGKLISHDCSQHGVMPKKSILLVHKHESLCCMPEYRPRIVFDNVELGLKITDFSALSAIRLAQFMGCNKFYLVSFDACTKKDGGMYNQGSKPVRSAAYFRQCARMKPFLEKINHEWITPEQKKETDIVYALGSGSRWKNNEIKYSLRSIEKHLKGWRNVFIVGIKPYGIDNIIHIPADDLLTNNADGNIARKVLLACADPRVSDTFLFINDDHLFVKDIHILDIPPYHKGNLSTSYQRYNQDSGLYLRRLKRTFEVLVKHKLPTLHYDCHTPILIDKHKFPGIIRSFDFEKAEGYGMKSLYGNSMRLKSPHLADMNIKIPIDYDKICMIAGERTIMAYNDAGLNEDLKRFLHDKFPNQSNFETMEKQKQVALHEAQVWLDNPKKSYKEGVRIYGQLGRDKRLLARFKQLNNEIMMQKLHKELSKLKDVLLKQGLEPVEPNTQNGPAPDQLQQPKQEKAKKTVETPAPQTSGRLHVDPNPSIDINLLPADKSALYERNQEITREITALHEKMKVEKKASERKKLAVQITEMEDARDINWQELDAWWNDYTSGKTEKQITEPSGKYTKDVIEAIKDPAIKALSKELRIKANINYIKRFKESAKKKQIDEVELRTREMNEWGEKIR